MDGSKTVLVTGCAGFIGFHVANRLLSEGYIVIGIDNMSPYYDPRLKESRLRILREKYGTFTFVQGGVEDSDLIERVLEAHPISYVIHLAAQAGVRYSLENPMSYIDSNIHGFAVILEACRIHKIRHLLYASSSSVYGANTAMPFSVHQNVDHPMSLYAATKKANELMAHAYSSLFDLPTTGLRFFTVYGPWGRPDMALFKFTKAILNGEPIQVFNYGNMRRDFTYIDDIVDAIAKLVEYIPQPNPQWNGDHPEPGSSYCRYRVYNIGSHRPIALNEFIDLLEKELGKKAVREYLPMQPGDVPETYADVTDLFSDVGFTPRVSVEEGVRRFVEWYKSYYTDDK
ncbi:NAD-dependent epimerase [Alicyclobacillus herbarius]|uniref:NAD-dependent epimerase n=1 Tax=Alicyclobacillus herbarius TaxID=122960 RepID=UPI0003F4DD62|nr:NAD-dependent epimerase [Alicyclobacillus herbarius]